LIDIDLPVDVEETPGDAILHFDWDSSGVANAVCRDFQATRTIHGRVLPQRHVLSGSLQLKNTGGRLTEVPLFPNREIRMGLDLNPESWALVEEALQSEDHFGKCGLFMEASDGLAFLKRLAATGVAVKLPASIFRIVDLPARVQESVSVNRRKISLGLTAESLRVEPATLWSSVSVTVKAGTPTDEGARSAPKRMPGS
jgi:hypothetical protein